MAKIITGTQLPARATLWPDEDRVLSGVEQSYALSLTAAYLSRVYQTPSANGDTRTQSVFLRAGTYTLYILCDTSTDRPIVDWYIDNTLVKTIDFYTASVVSNFIFSFQVTLQTDGYHVIKSVVNGKNASATNYNALWQKVWLKQASDLSPSTGGNKTFTLTDLPIRAVAWHDEATVLTGNVIAYTIDTGHIFNHFARQSTSADADSFTNSVFLRAGTYTFSVEGQTNAANGKIDWYLDGVSFTTGQDWYSAAQTKNVVKTASVTIAGDGYHVLKGVINGKNASSSGFNMDLTVYWFRTAAD